MAADNPRMLSLHPVHRTRSGFTLVELLIALAVMAVLAAVAWPSFREAVQRSRRADAMSALANIMQAQERWRANNPSYKDVLSELVGAAKDQSADNHYALSLADVTATAYTAIATARSTSPQSSDGRCQVLKVVVDRGSIEYKSAASGGVANTGTDPCWVR